MSKVLKIRKTVKILETKHEATAIFLSSWYCSTEEVKDSDKNVSNV